MEVVGSSPAVPAMVGVGGGGVGGGGVSSSGAAMGGVAFGQVPATAPSQGGSVVALLQKVGTWSSNPLRFDPPDRSRRFPHPKAPRYCNHNHG